MSMGPLTLKEEQHEGEPSPSDSFNAASQNGSSKATNWTASGVFPSVVEKGRIVAGAVSGNLKRTVPYSSPWFFIFSVGERDVYKPRRR